MGTLGSDSAVTLCLVILATVAMVTSGARLHRVKRSSAGAAAPNINLGNIASWAGLGGGIGFRQATSDVIHSHSGNLRCRVMETYQDLVVWGGFAEVELNSEHDLTGHIYGHVYTHLDEDIADVTACMRDPLGMVNLAVVHEALNPSDEYVDNKVAQRVVYVDPQTGRASIAYEVAFTYTSATVVSAPLYVIGACDLAVLLSYNQVQNTSYTTVNSPQAELDQPKIRCQDRRPKKGLTCDPSVTGAGGNEKIGCVVYNERPNCLRPRIRKQKGTCIMKNKYARVYDNKQSRSTKIKNVVKFDCEEGYQDAINGAYGVANDAFFFGNIIGEFYEEKYLMRVLPYVPRFIVHFGVNYENAFWNGYDMFFGDGYKTFHPLVSLDVAAHELAHGITSRNSRLVYKHQSGGINEAFSDISGEVVEHYGRDATDWRIGWDIFKSQRALRYMYNPPLDGRSIKHVNDYKDSQNVHYTSGIYNYAFYRLVEVEKMNIYDAYTCFLHANLLMWTPSTNFTEGACGVLQTCEDNGFKCRSVVNAFKEVGIDLSDCDSYALTPVLTPGQSRSHVVVSEDTEPTFELDLTDSSDNVMVKTSTRGKTKITLTLTGNRDGTDKLDEGRGLLNITVSEVNNTNIFLTLSNDSKQKTMVHLQIV